MKLDQLATHRQPEAGAAEAPGGIPLRLLERKEDPLMVGGVDADAGVGDRHREKVFARPAGEGRDPHLSSRSELHRIADQVVQHLGDAVLVGVGERQTGRHVVEQHQVALADQRPGEGQDDVDQGAHVDRPQVERERLVLELGEVEQVVDQRAEPAAAGDDHREVVHRRLGQRTGGAVGERFGQTDDAVQRCA